MLVSDIFQLVRQDDRRLGPFMTVCIINKIAKPYLQQLERSARKLEDHYKEIRTVRFNVENKKLWLYDQYPAMAKSAQSEIRTIIDLFNRNIIDDREVVRRIKPGQLNEILHSIMDKRSVGSMKKTVGGITGAPGAAIGRVYFTTEALLDAHKVAMQKGLETRMILCMPATYAGDVKAIEVATGVLSNEGGYSAHASVVARQYGKVSLVKPDLRIRQHGLHRQRGDQGRGLPHPERPLLRGA